MEIDDCRIHDTEHQGSGLGVEVTSFLFVNRGHASVLTPLNSKAVPLALTGPYLTTVIIESIDFRFRNCVASRFSKILFPQSTTDEVES